MSVVAVLIGGASQAAAQQTTPTQLPAQPQPGVPPAAGSPVPPATTGVGQLPVTPATVPLGPVCPAPVPPATAPSRAFTAPTGIVFNQVAPTRVADFEKLIGYVRDALAKTTNATLRKQADGWNFYKSPEPGPNGDVIYVFLFTPAVPCADYALNAILAEAYPDPAQLSEIWNLYKTSVRGGGTLMNLLPVPAPAQAPTPVTPPSTPVAPPAAARP